MRIIQSFWSAGRNMITDNAGWLSPQHHLIGWALSCLKLKEHYEEVELYTDQTGYEWLIGKMKLPYTKVHVVLDGLDTYKKELWALAKVKTYSLQQSPFLHVDGDVFIWMPFPESLHHAPLVAQNLEKATGYYAHKFKPINARLQYLPAEFDFDVVKTEIAGCNAGIMGGTDYTFFRRYSQLAFDMVNRNNLDHLSSQTLIDFNIVFEQILFYQLSLREGKEIHGLFDKVYTDNGYLYDEIGDFTTLPYTTKYIHLLGQHKRSEVPCELMSRFLMAEYPEYFFRITALFTGVALPDMQTAAINTPIFSNNLQTSTLAQEPAEDGIILPGMIRNITDFKIILETLRKETDHISDMQLLQRDRANLRSNRFFLQGNEAQQDIPIERDPLLKIAVLSKEAGNILFERTALEHALIDSTFQVALLPDLSEKRYKAALLEPLDYVILSYLEEKITLSSLLEAVAASFSGSEISTAYNDFYTLVMIALKKLNINKCIQIHFQ